MTMNRIFFGALGLALMALGMQLPANAQAIQLPAGESPAVESQVIKAQPLKAQTVGGPTALASTQSAQLEPAQPAQPAQIEAASWTQPESLSASGLKPAASPEQQVNTEAAQLTSPASEESTDIAQARRRTRGVRAPGSDFVGIGADFGTASNVSFAVISKLTLRDQIAVRPSVIVGNDFAVLVPVTYDFSRFNADVQGFQIRPYAGVGASYVDNSGSSVGLLLTAGVDVPVARSFTANAQANYAGIFSDSSNFGVTVGVGYNFSGLGR